MHEWRRAYALRKPAPHSIVWRRRRAAHFGVALRARYVCCGVARRAAPGRRRGWREDVNMRRISCKLSVSA